MELTKDDVERIGALVPSASVMAADDGIRIYGGTIGEFIGEVLRAALTLELHPSQVVDNSVLSDGYYYSSYTWDTGSIDLDVTFLYRPK